METARYATRSLKGDRFWPEFIKIFSVFMASVFGLIFLGLPVFAVWVISMAVLFFYAASRTANAVYVLGEEGIAQQLTPLLGKRKIKTRFFPWNEIEWYQDGTELSRSGTEYHYLKVGFINSPVIWNLTTLHGDPVSFEHFLSAFLSQMPAQTLKKEHPSQQKITPTGSTIHVQRRKTFYESIWGKIIALLFLGITLVLVYLMWSTGIDKGSYLFKMAFVIIPGTAYMLYLSFLK